jgi:hypothetical protein
VLRTQIRNKNIEIRILKCTKHSYLERLL